MRSMNKKYRMRILILSLLFIGCATYIGPITSKRINYRQYRRESYVYNHPEIDEEAKTDILAGTVWIGMTKEQFLATRDKPRSINRTATKSFAREQWVYGGFDWNGHFTPYNFYYFEKGILVVFQVED